MHAAQNPAHIHVDWLSYERLSFPHHLLQALLSSSGRLAALPYNGLYSCPTLKQIGLYQGSGKRFG
jgi:hypothetical protein